MTRDKILAIKAEQVAKEIDAWAKEQGILKPGEQLAFSLQIRHIPFAVRDEQDLQQFQLLAMKATDFFSKKGLIEAGVANSLATRTARLLRNIYGTDRRYYWKLNEDVNDPILEENTVGEIIEKCTAKFLLKQDGSGKATVRAIKILLRKYGLEIREE